MNEVWKDVKNYEGTYQVSNLGRVKSLSRIDFSGRQRGEVILRLKNPRKRYPYVILYKYGKSKTYYVHRLVASHFIENIRNKPEVNHIDGNKENNCVDNLEWVDRKENSIHAYRNGLLNPDVSVALKALNDNRAHYSKIVAEKNSVPIFVIKSNGKKEFFRSIKEATIKLNIDHKTISRSLKQKVKTRSGLIFYYCEEENVG